MTSTVTALEHVVEYLAISLVFLGFVTGLSMMIERVFRKYK